LTIVYLDLGEDVSGLLISKGGSTVIAVQETDSLSRQRFTIAHEIGHFHLRHQFEPGEHVHVDRGHLITPRNSRSSTGGDLKEIEANQFAACLLMPSSLLSGTVKALRVEPLCDDHVTHLASEFEVSEQAMTIRLSTLGYL
jgi:Zn-dependent peptidase ImmA (M78 family)